MSSTTTSNTTVHLAARATRIAAIRANNLINQITGHKTARDTSSDEDDDSDRSIGSADTTETQKQDRKRMRSIAQHQAWQYEVVDLTNEPEVINLINADPVHIDLTVPVPPCPEVGSVVAVDHAPFGLLGFVPSEDTVSQELLEYRLRAAQPQDYSWTSCFPTDRGGEKWSVPCTVCKQVPLPNFGCVCREMFRCGPCAAAGELDREGCIHFGDMCCTGYPSDFCHCYEHDPNAEAYAGSDEEDEGDAGSTASETGSTVSDVTHE